MAIRADPEPDPEFSCPAARGGCRAVPGLRLAFSVRRTSARAAARIDGQEPWPALDPPQSPPRPENWVCMQAQSSAQIIRLLSLHVYFRTCTVEGAQRPRLLRRHLAAAAASKPSHRRARQALVKLRLAYRAGCHRRPPAVVGPGAMVTARDGGQPCAILIARTAFAIERAHTPDAPIPPPIRLQSAMSSA